MRKNPLLTVRTHIRLACLLMTAVTVSLGMFILRNEGRLGRLALNTYDQALTSISFVREAGAKFEQLRGRYALAEVQSAAANGKPIGFDAAVAASQIDDIADELDTLTERAAPGRARDATVALRRLFVDMAAQAADIPGSMMRLTAASGAFQSVIEQFSQEGVDFRLHEEAAIVSAIRRTWVALGAAVLAAIAITVGLSRTIVPGLRLATSAASAMAAGRLDEAIPVRRGSRNETAVLLGALGGMQSTIRQQLAHIRALHDEAEATQSTVVRGLAQGLQRLALGDFTFRLEHAFAPEYEQIKTDFNDAANQLQQMIRGIANNAAMLNAGTAQIANAADELSQRSERQAASLQQTTLAMDGIAARVRQTAMGAQHASSIVSQTKADTEQSEAVVGRAAQAMTTIEHASRQITQIIHLINDIAFQTRLLALNAGIEASRAGAAGRSFAVVASEVRALAQRSSQAAKQIKSLISASNERVDEGVTMVSHLSAALRRIMGQVSEVNAVVGEIAAANAEQSLTVQEIHATILLMDQVTRQNAAMVEESTTATHALAHETNELLELTTRFRVNDEDDSQTGPASGHSQQQGGYLELF